MTTGWHYVAILCSCNIALLQRRMQEENLRKQEESVQKQETMRRGWLACYVHCSTHATCTLAEVSVMHCAVITFGLYPSLMNPLGTGIAS